jgi:predicted nucleic acid-binding protein
LQTFGDHACHPFAALKGKLREGSGSTDGEILRCAQDDSRDTTQVFSPNVWETCDACVLRALDLYASTNLDFGDTLIIASMEQQNSHVLYSYDTGFDRIQGVARREP